MLTTAKQLVIYGCGLIISPLLFLLVGRLLIGVSAHDGPGPSGWAVYLGVIAWVLLTVGFVMGIEYYDRQPLEEDRHQAWDYPSHDTENFWRNWKTDRYAIRTPTWYPNCVSPELCPRCFNIISASKLLLGSWKIFVPAKESYVFHPNELFEPSSEACMLCNLLLSTIIPQNTTSTYNNSNGVDVALLEQTYGTCLPNRFEYKLHIFEAIGVKGQTYLQLAVPGHQCPAFPAFPAFPMSQSRPHIMKSTKADLK